MNEKCEKWHEQLQHLRDKHTEFLQTYADALEFAEQNPKVRETSFAYCRVLFNEIKPLIMKLREDFPRLTKEQLAELAILKTRFDEQPRLHEGIQWEDVEKALMASPDDINKLMILDEKGHEMNAVGEENGKFIFVSAWHNTDKLIRGHGEMCYDRESQKESARLGLRPNNNAVDIAGSMGVDLAEPKFHQLLIDNLIDVAQLSRVNHPVLRKSVTATARRGVKHYMRKISGSAWLKTNTATRKTGKAFLGDGTDIYPMDAYHLSGYSFRAELRVKKA